MPSAQSKLPRFGLVVPAKDPGASFEPHMNELVLLASSRGSCEILVVDDGSTRTNVASRVSLPVTCLRHNLNKGKGAALRTGFLHFLSTGYEDDDLIGFIDADGDIPASWAFTLASLAAGADLVIGAKTSSHIASPYRKLASGVFSFLAGILMPTSVSETQVGVKVFKAGFLRRHLPHTVSDGFLLDVELLSCAYQNQSRVHVAGVDYITAKSESTVTKRHVLQMFASLCKLSLMTRRGRKFKTR
jgi:glycosyltransferase involved in cell wall biosynthesis